MKKMMKHTINTILFPALLLGWMLSSCIDENENLGGEALVTISLAPAQSEPDATDTRGYGDGSIGLQPEDNHILEFRVLAFRASTGLLQYNAYLPNISGNTPLVMNMVADTYDFVFIANEGSDANLHTRLEAYIPGSSYKMRSNIESETFASTAFDENKPIPMSAFVKNVEVIGNQQYKIDGGSLLTANPWNVALTRLAIRVDIRLFTESSTKATTFQQIEFHNVPSTVPILAQKKDNSYTTNGGTYETTHYPVISTANDGGGGFASTTTPSAGYVWTKSRIILPSSYFTPTTTKANGIQVKVKYTSGSDGEFVLAADAATNFTAPRNTYYVVFATLTMSGNDVFITAPDWTVVNPDAIIGEKRLNVEFTSVTVANGGNFRLHFWSNQASVYVEETGYTGTTGTTTYTVNTKFNTLSGTSAANLNYTPATGLGYININPTATGTNRIFLNADGLRREITVIVP
jgi:hypothetical protein